LISIHLKYPGCITSFYISAFTWKKNVLSVSNKAGSLHLEELLFMVIVYLNINPHMNICMKTD